MWTFIAAESNSPALWESTVKPSKRDRIGDRILVLVERLVPSQRFSVKFIVCHYVTIIHYRMTNHKNNHVAMNFTTIMSQYNIVRGCLNIPIIQGFVNFSILGCMGCLTLLPGALDLYRDRINSLFFRMVFIWVFPLLNIPLSLCIYSRIPANTPDYFNLLFKDLLV